MSDIKVPDGMPGWAIGILFSVVSAMAGIIAKMFYMMRSDAESRIAKLEAEAKDCRDDRERLWEEIAGFKKEAAKSS